MRPDNFQNSQMISLLVVANQYNLNPFTREIYAFPDKGSIIPIVSIDGWVTMANQHDQFDGVSFIESDEIVDVDGISCCTWMECSIYKKGCSHPVTIREYFNETYRKPFKSKAGKIVRSPWQTHPRRMLRHKTFIQCARLAFGFSGIYDPDEARNIIDSPKPQYAPDSGKVYETKAKAIYDILEDDLGENHENENK